MQLTESQQQLFTRFEIPIPVNLHDKTYDYHYRNLISSLEAVLPQGKSDRNYMETEDDLLELRECINHHNGQKATNPHLPSDLEKIIALYSVMHIAWNSQLLHHKEITGVEITRLKTFYPALIETLEVWAWG